jgi:integrase
VQHLTKSYSIAGPKDEENFAKEESVRSYRKGYKRHLHLRGVRPKRAKVFKEDKVDDLVRYLERQVAETRGLRRCVNRMDLTAVLYLWESWCRGKECGELQRDQVDLDSKEARPGWSKTCRDEPSATIGLSEGGRGRFVESAALLIKEMENIGCPVETGYLFRLVNKQRGGFENCALSAAALRKIVLQHLKDAELYAGEMLHIFRRSAAQNAARVEGYDVRRLMELGRWKSYEA